MIKQSATEAKLKVAGMALVAAIISLNVIWYTQLKYVINGSVLGPFESGWLYESLFVWQPLSHSGVFFPSGSVVIELIYSLYMFVKVLFGLSVWFSFSIAFPYLIGAVGMFLLVFELTKNAGVKTSLFSSIIASLVFTLHSNSNAYLGGGPGIPAIFFPFGFLFLYLLFSTLEKDKGQPNLFYLSGAALFFYAAVAIGGITFFVQNMILISLLLLILTVTSKPGLRKTYVMYSAIILASVLVMNAPFIVSGFELSRSLMATKDFISNAYSFDLKQTTQPILRYIFGFISTDYTIGLSAISAASAILILSVSLLSIYFINDKPDIKKRFVIALFIIYLSFVFFSTTESKPFGDIFVYLLKIFPYLITFRFPYIATYYALLLPVSILFGIGSAWSLSSLTTKRYAWCMLLIAIVVSSLIYFFATDLAGPSGVKRTDIPAYVFEISDFINSNGGGYATALLPISAPIQITNWYLGTNIYPSFINTATYTGGYDIHSNSFSEPISLIEYRDIGYRIGNHSMSGQSLSNLFGIFGIKYIIVQGDTSNTLSTPFSFNTIYGNLNSSSGIKFVKGYGNSSIYENDAALPLVYASNIKDMGNATMDEMLEAVADPSFNIRNTSTYANAIKGVSWIDMDSSIPDPYNAFGKAEVGQISGFRAPNITFEENTPASVTVYVSGASTPFYLVFRETYYPGWSAYYENGTEIDSKYHISVNGFANAWLISKGGDYSIKLYYTPQTTAWASLAVSLAGIAAVCCAGWAGLRRKAATKRRVRR